VYVFVFAEMFGISDHDLMFTRQASKAVEGDAASSDDENTQKFILNKVNNFVSSYWRQIIPISPVPVHFRFL